MGFKGVMMMEKIKVGIIGCGNISGIYFANLTKKFAVTELVACADLDFERAKAKAEEFGVKAVTVDELLADPQIRIIVNLTIPKAHAQVCLAAIDAGKSVHVEKPFAVTREEGKKILERAKEKGVLVGAAPDTFMGSGIQTCRKLIDEGWIGTPLAVTAVMLCHGHESWHPDPEFYYEEGGGPMFDMGPYYLTALVNLLGPVRRVTASTCISLPQRTITSEKKNGKVIDVKVPTHIAGVMDFHSGVVGTIITSFDVWGHNMPGIEIYGSEGTIVVPDPNSFGGPVMLKRFNSQEWTQMPLAFPHEENSRGVGVADMAMALLTGRKNRANGDLGYHVLELMHGFHDASNSNTHYIVESTCERPATLPMGLAEGEID